MQLWRLDVIPSVGQLHQNDVIDAGTDFASHEIQISFLFGNQFICLRHSHSSAIDSATYQWLPTRAVTIYQYIDILQH